MEEIWSTVVLVDRGSSGLWGAGILSLVVCRYRLMADKDLLHCTDHFPFHKDHHKDLYLPDLDLLTHQAPDFLAPEKCQSLTASFRTGEDVKTWKEPVVTVQTYVPESSVSTDLITNKPKPSSLDEKV